MRWPDLPPLTTLVAFEAVARLQSVTRAASELHLTHGAISRQIRQLEHELGQALFKRQHRGMAPTPAARALAAAVNDALRTLDSCGRDLRQDPQRRPLVLSCEPTLLMRWLIPRLGSLAAQHPGLDLRLSAGGGPVDLRRERIDAAIRRDDFPLPHDVTVEPLFEERIGPVYGRQTAHERVLGADEVLRLPRLHTATRPEAWDVWAGRRGVELPTVPEQTFEHFYLSLQAASAGLGVAIGPLALVHDDIQAAQLLAPDGFLADGTSYVLLTDPSPQDGRIGLLVSWLRDLGAELDTTRTMTD